MQALPTPLAPLGAYKQFIIIKLIPQSDGKTQKLPINPANIQPFEKGGDWQNRPELWWDFDTVATMVNAMGPQYCVGFLLTENDPFMFLDIDGCLEPTGQWSQASCQMMAMFPGAAMEVSQSGTGLHLFGTYSSMPEHAKRDVHKLGAELYSSKRVVALTGVNAVGDASADVTALLPPFIDYYFPPKVVANAAGWTTEPVENYTSTETDAELIERALSTTSAMAHFDTSAVGFRELWENDEVKLAVRFPPDSTDTYNRSSADMALASHLAFWTGGNCERIQTLMLQSGLVREKWEWHTAYLTETIERAVALQTSFYSVREPVDTVVLEACGAVKLKGSSPEQVAYAENVRSTILSQAAPEDAALLAKEANASLWIDNKDVPADQLAAKVRPIETAACTPVDTVKMRSGFQYVSAEMQLDFFAGCVYVSDIHKVVTPRGQKLNPDRFNAIYGGYVFQIDDTGKKTTNKAWDAFVNSQVLVWPKADRASFRPDKPHGAIFELDGEIHINTYKELDIEEGEGDVTPFLNHLKNLLPKEHDRNVILAYSAACVQHIGCKFKWAPLIQGVPGNGKSLISDCISYAVGERYTHMPEAKEVTEKYNDWLFNNVFVNLEDVYYPDSKIEVLESLKPMITQRFRPMRAMGQSQVMSWNCANFFFNSNHKNAIAKTKDDRRFFVVYCPQQTKEDKVKYGMDKHYFRGPNGLVTWLENGGYAKVRHFLRNYEIPAELNPAVEAGGLALEAPLSSMNDEVLEESRGGIEANIIEAAEEQRVGFANGWLSSVALADLLKEIRKESMLPPGHRRKRVLEELGYIPHPGLEGGRMPRKSKLHPGKPRLYIKRGHPEANLRSSKAILGAYERDQQNATSGVEVADWFEAERAT